VPSRQDQLHSYQYSLQRVVAALVTHDPDPSRSPLRHNTFTTVDPPVGVGSAVTGINDRGDITIVGLDAANALVGAYRRTGAGLSSVRFPGNTHDTNPGAIDDWGRVAGVFATDFYRYTDGFVTLTDGSYVRLLRTDQLNGMNNHLQVVGFRDGHAFVATFPPGTGH